MDLKESFIKCGAKRCELKFESLEESNFMRSTKDINFLKEVFLDVFDIRRHEEKYTLAKRRLVLKNRYPSVSVNTSNVLVNFEKIYDNEIVENIKNLAIEDINRKDIEDSEKIELLNKEILGNVFSSHDLLTLEKQLFLESKLTSVDYQTELKVIKLVWYKIGNAFYYRKEENELKTLFNCCFDLYLCNTDKKYEPNESTKMIIAAAKNLRRHFNFEIKIENGDIELPLDTCKTIHFGLEKMLKRIGAKEVLETLFYRYLIPQYDDKFDRFLIHRNKTLYGKSSKGIPYNYIINLAAKNLLLNESSILSSKVPDEIKQNEVNELISLAADYLEVFNVQDKYVYSDASIDIRTLPNYIFNNIVYEKFCFPFQYSSDFIDLIIRELYKSYYEELNNKPCSYKKFIKLVHTILTYKEISLITLSEINRKTAIKKTEISEILEFLAQPMVNVNAEYDNYNSKTSIRNFPLMKIDDESYLILSSPISGYSICEVLYKKIISERGKSFNRELGYAFEKLAKKILWNKGFSFCSGIYYNENNEEAGECDIVLETDKKILFIEIKKTPLPINFENCDDLEVYRSLGEGMLYAQKQILNHRLHLKKFGKLELFDKENEICCWQNIETNQRQIYGISVCLPEYNFFTTKNLSKTLTESLVYMNYSTNDPNKNERLKNLNKLAKDFRELINEYTNGIKISSHELLFNVSFRSFQQFYLALKESSSVEDFIEYLTCDNNMMIGSLDFYAQLNWKMSLKQNM